MGGDVKAQLSVVADVVAMTSGVQLAVRHGFVGRVTVEGACTVKPASAREQCLVGTGDPSPGDQLDRPGGIEAVVFFREMREPTFYLGFSQPLLRSELRGGIAWPWGLRGLHRRPVEQWMLTLESYSPLEPGLGVLDGTRASTSSTSASVSYCFRCSAGAYTSCCFHIASAVAAIFRASVNFARFGFVPCSSRRS